MKSIILAIALTLGLVSAASAECYVTTFDWTDLDGSIVHIDHNLNADAVVPAIYSPQGWYWAPGGNSLVQTVQQVSPNRLDLRVEAGEFELDHSIVYSIRVCK